MKQPEVDDSGAACSLGALNCRLFEHPVDLFLAVEIEAKYYLAPGFGMV